MRAAWLLGLLMVPGLAHAEASKAFAQLRDRAQPVESLATFLTSFVGDCGSDPMDASNCKQKVDAFRKESIGKTYYLILGDDAQKLVQPRGFSPKTHEMEFALTPFFESAGLAITHGQPTKLDADDHPIIPLIRMQSTLADEITPMDVDRVFRTNNVRIQVIYKPLGIWRIPRHEKKNSFVEGVKAQVLGVRITESRTGSELASWIAPK